MKDYSKEKMAGLAQQFGVSDPLNTRSTGADSPQVSYNNLLDKPPVSVGATIYAGNIASGGTAGTFFPTGWSVSSGGTGAYLVTHNLGNTNYSVVATCVITSVSVRIAHIYNETTTTFYIEIFDATATSQDCAVNFILTTTANP